MFVSADRAEGSRELIVRPPIELRPAPNMPPRSAREVAAPRGRSSLQDWRDKQIRAEAELIHDPSTVGVLRLDEPERADERPSPRRGLLREPRSIGSERRKNAGKSGEK